MLAAYGYGSGYGTAPGISDLLSMSAEMLSLLFILASLVIVAYLTTKVKTRRSFQFEMFLFTLVLASAEIPRILYSFSRLDLGPLVTYGLAIHTVSMVVLAAFVAYRTYGFFRGGENVQK
ncbi:MAG: hypothetical protein LYZ70_06730 [Nitrososphaerales archaeon]|nr:hypothetical protein [Nitrososphaerales archaeon]